MLEVFHLRKEFGDFAAVADLSFQIDRGAVCGFVGPNGAGKTTTMRMIATLDMPTRGEIRVDGRSIFDAPYAARRAIGFMPDHLGVYPSMNVTDYLEFYARAYEIEHAERDRRVAEVKDFTELSKIEDKLVETLSKGMRQRLNLGRALLNNPRLLIMDEPAAGLDPRARVELRELIKAMAEMGKTVFISSHILSELGEMCDAMLVIERGQLVIEGTLERIKGELRKRKGAAAGSNGSGGEGQGAGNQIALLVRLLPDAPAAKLQARLLELPSVSGAKAGPNNALSVDFHGDEAEAAALLKRLVDENFPVVEFAPKHETMEELFMQLTTGEVQ